MIPPLDIFRLDSDGQLTWRTSADGVDSAQRRVKILMASEPADYLIYSQETGHKTLVDAKPTPNPHFLHPIDTMRLPHLVSTRKLPVPTLTSLVHSILP